jgi:hypothetical protein
MSNLNASGDYAVSLIMQTDFNTNSADQYEVNINLSSNNAIWGDFNWSEGIWGSFSVFQDRIRLFSRFRAIRFAISHRKAGQPWQINSMSISCQDKALFYGSS